MYSIISRLRKIMTRKTSETMKAGVKMILNKLCNPEYNNFQLSTETFSLWRKLWVQHGLYLLTYLLTYSMVQSPSWEANWFAASQEITRISRNPKVHYRTHKRPPPISILGQPNPVHIPISHLMHIHPNPPSTPRSPQWSHPLRFPHQDPVHSPPLSSPIRGKTDFTFRKIDNL